MMTFEHGVLDAIPQVTDFHSWVAGRSPRYKRRLCSCGCQNK